MIVTNRAPLAYYDDEFLDSDDGRYYREARELARLVTEWLRSLCRGTCRFVVCTGGGLPVRGQPRAGAHRAAGSASRGAGARGPGVRLEKNLLPARGWAVKERKKSQ